MQLVQTEAPAAEYLPAIHEAQLDEDVAAEEATYVPARQEAQLAFPVMAMYLPAAQLVQALAPEAEKVPAAQLVQPFALVVAEYFPP